MALTTQSLGCRSSCTAATADSTAAGPVGLFRMGHGLLSFWGDKSFSALEWPLNQCHTLLGATLAVAPAWLHGRTASVRPTLLCLDYGRPKLNQHTQTKSFSCTFL